MIRAHKKKTRTQVSPYHSGSLRHFWLWSVNTFQSRSGSQWFSRGITARSIGLSVEERLAMSPATLRKREKARHMPDSSYLFFTWPAITFHRGAQVESVRRIRSAGVNVIGDILSSILRPFHGECFYVTGTWFSSAVNVETRGTVTTVGAKTSEAVIRPVQTTPVKRGKKGGS